MDCNPKPSCTCVTCHQHGDKGETQNTFENVATVIGIYKLASHWARVVQSDPNATPRQKLDKQYDLEDAEDMLEELVDNTEKLSPASRQQLRILFSEMRVLGT